MSEGNEKMDVMFNPDKLRFSLMVAACKNMGMGKDGKLPWNLPKEMHYFKTLTTTTKDPSRKNAVVMGRRTWEGIPPQHRPLKNRINVVISSTMDTALSSNYFCDNEFVNAASGDEGFGGWSGGLLKVCKSWDEALTFLSSLEISRILERIWIIGGFSLYEVAGNSPHCEYVYLTRINKEYDCDVFFPADEIGLHENFELSLAGIQDLKALGFRTCGEEDNGVEFKYEVYKKKKVGF